jgi:hypothetical protein
MPTKAIDELIDSGKEKEVYKLFNCKNPKHDPYEFDSKYKSKCNGCPALRTEKKEPEIKARDFPPGAYVPLSAIVDETIYHCRVGDYISARTEFYKKVKSVF